MSVNYENTYWNHKGKHEDLNAKLEKLIPASGEVKDHKNNRALEKFRIASNCYYDLYNNGLCNRTQEFTKVFGFKGSSWPGWRSGKKETMQSFCNRTETRMDEIILAAYAEQFPALHTTKSV